MQQSSEKSNFPAYPGKASPCIVGIGASAGGIEALQAFFRAMPPDSGIGFVIIQHLDPTHKSLTAELLSKITAMQVVEAEEGMCVEPDHVYTLPSNAFLAIREGILRREQPPESATRTCPLTIFSPAWAWTGAKGPSASSCPGPVPTARMASSPSPPMAASCWRKIP